MDARADVAAKIQRNIEVSDLELILYLKSTVIIHQLDEQYRKQLISLNNADLSGLNFSKLRLSGISFTKNKFHGTTFLPEDAFVSEARFIACLDEVRVNHAAAILDNDEELNAYQQLLLDNIMRAFENINSFHQKHVLLALAYDHSLFKETKLFSQKAVSSVSVMQQASPLLRRASETKSSENAVASITARN